MVPLESHLPLALALAFSGVVGLAILALASFLGPSRRTATKLEAFECGNPSSGAARGPFAVKFYLVALLFIVFEVELAFFYPWAVLLQELGWFGFASMFAFAVTLLIGLAYVWRRGALDWVDESALPTGAEDSAEGSLR